MMSAEENKALARRELEEIFTQGNLDAAEEIYAPSYISHQPAGDDDIRGVEAIKQFAAGMREAFPDLEITIEDQIAEGDKVVTRFRTRGTHQGELWGMPPTGKEVEITNVSVCRIEGARWPRSGPLPTRHDAAAGSYRAAAWVAGQLLQSARGHNIWPCLLAFIHQSVWKVNSAKFSTRLQYTQVAPRYVCYSGALY